MCGVEENIEHIFMQCKRFQKLRRRHGVGDEILNIKNWRIGEKCRDEIIRELGGG